MLRSRPPSTMTLLGIIALGVGMLVPTLSFAGAGDLLQVEYKIFGRVEKAIGEVDFDQRGERVSLTLFNERLADYYTLYLPFEDLVSHTRISTAEASKVVRERTDLRKRKLEQRRAAAEAKAQQRAQERAAETKQRIAKGEPLRRTNRERARGFDLPGSDGASSVDRIAVTPLTSDEVFTQLEEELGPIASNVEKHRAELTELDKRIAALVSGSSIPRAARLVRGEVRTHLAKLEKVQSTVDRRRRDIDRLRTAVVDGKIRDEDLIERSEVLLRQLYGVNRGLKKLQVALAPMEQKIGELPSVMAVAAAKSDNSLLAETRVSGAAAHADVAKVEAAVKIEARGDDEASDKESVSDRPRSRGKRDRVIVAPPIDLGDEGMSPLLMFLGSSTLVLLGVLALAMRRPRLKLAREEA